jgi:hypothetical protein
MLPPLKMIITFVLYKLQSSYGACLKANEMLFSEIYNSHSDSTVLVSMSPDVTSDLQFLTKCNFFPEKKYLVHNVVV